MAHLSAVSYLCSLHVNILHHPCCLCFQYLIVRIDQTCEALRSMCAWDDIWRQCSLREFSMAASILVTPPHDPLSPAGLLLDTGGSAAAAPSGSDHASPVRWKNHYVSRVLIRRKVFQYRRCLVLLDVWTHDSSFHSILSTVCFRPRLSDEQQRVPQSNPSLFTIPDHFRYSYLGLPCLSLLLFYLSSSFPGVAQCR